MSKDAVYVAGKIIMLRNARNINTVDQSSEEDVYILHEASLSQSTADIFLTVKIPESGNFMNTGYWS